MGSHVNSPSNKINYHKPSEKQAVVINPDALAKEIIDAMEEWNDALSENIETLTIEYAKEGVKALKANAPKRSGAYASSMAYDLTKGARFTKAVLRNRKHYQLTHLLEKGHATRLSSGKYGSKSRASAFVHWKPIEEEITNGFYDDLKKLIGG